MSITISNPNQNLNLSLPDEGAVFRDTADNTGTSLYTIKNGALSSIAAPTYTANTTFKDNTTGVTYQKGQAVPGNPRDITWLDPSYRGGAVSPTTAGSVYDSSNGAGSYEALPTYNVADINTGLGILQSNNVAYGNYTVAADPSIQGYQNPNAVNPTTGNYQATPGTPAGATPGAATTTPGGVNAGRTAVTLGNGNTVYYDKTGQAYDSNGAPVSNTTIAQSTAPTNGTPGAAATPTAPPAPISNPVPPPSASGTLTLPQAQAPAVADQFNTSLAATIAAQQAQLQQALQAQQQNYQTQIDALKQQSSDALNMENMGLSSEQSTVAAETAAKQAALDAEQKQFQENYDARQKLTDQLSTLLTTGQQVIQQMQGTTGLASIMNPRVSQTMTDVQAQAGVITATLSAMSDQIGLAQNQLQSATAAISSIYNDQINYWQNVISFYNDQQKQDNAQISNLTNDQKTYIDAQIQTLQDNIAQTQSTATLVQKAMLDPSTALTYAKAGVTLNDTVEQINQKLAVQAYAQEKADTANQMSTNGYTTTPNGTPPVPIVDSQGNTTNYYKAPTDNSFTLGTNQVKFDAQGNVIASGPTSTTPAQGANGTTGPAPTTSSGSSSSSSAGTTTTLAGVIGGKTYESGQLSFSSSDYQNSVNTLTSTTIKDAQGNPNMGSDGYVNPQVYLNGLNAWIAAGGLTADYVKLFPVSKYINPANTWPQIAALRGGSGSTAAASGPQLP